MSEAKTWEHDGRVFCVCPKPDCGRPAAPVGEEKHCSRCLGGASPIEEAERQRLVAAYRRAWPDVADVKDEGKHHDWSECMHPEIEHPRDRPTLNLTPWPTAEPEERGGVDMELSGCWKGAGDFWYHQCEASECRRPTWSSLRKCTKCYPNSSAPRAVECEAAELKRLRENYDHAALRAQGICVEPWGEDALPPECETNGEEPVRVTDVQTTSCVVDGPLDEPCDRVLLLPNLEELAGSDHDTPAPEGMGADASDLDDALRYWAEQPGPERPVCGHDPSRVTSSGHCIECSWGEHRPCGPHDSAKHDRAGLLESLTAPVCDNYLADHAAARRELERICREQGLC